MQSPAQSYFLDSSTLIHAADKNAQYHKECLNIVIKSAKGQINAATSIETLEETLFILSKVATIAMALRATRDLLKMGRIKKYEMNIPIFEQALELMEVIPIKRPKDAINVATMLGHDIKVIISEDKDYDRVSLIQRIHPKDLV